MEITPYIFFAGDAEEALEFYAAAGLGEIAQLGRYADAPPGAGPPSTPEQARWVMHARLVRGGRTLLMASDGRNTERGGPMKRATLSVGVDTAAEGERLFAALSDGGRVTMPFQPTFWAAGFGLFTDRFGIDWMVNCDAPQG